MMGLLTAMLSLLFSAERAKPIQLLLWFCHADPARRHVIPPSLVTKTSAHLPRIVSNNEKKTQREMKKKNVARKAAGLELQEPNWDCICKQQKQPEMQESCPGALGSDVATNHTWRRALRLSCLLAATAGPAQPPA